MTESRLLEALARAFLAGEPTIPGMISRANRALGRNWRWLPALARGYSERFSGSTRPRERDVVEFFKNDVGFRRAWAKYSDELHPATWLNESNRMQPIAAAGAWNVPVIETIGALADWFQITADELLWFADLKGLTYKAKEPRLSHYHYSVLTKKSGAVRIIEAPKSKLKQLQRQVLAQILDRIPAHPCANGFVRSRSVRTFVQPHVARHVVLKLDLRDFFPSISRARVQTIFRMMGYPEPVADLLGGLCTNAVPRCVWSAATPDAAPSALDEARWIHTRAHLPQGAPTSPALANICAYRADCRLHGLAGSAGAEYTRYADDLAFSGAEEFERGVERFSSQVAAILLEEGFTVNHRKTRIMRRGVRQRLAGVVVNQRLNVARGDFDRLKATLNNCARLGPNTQNRRVYNDFRAHLEGRIQWIESLNPAKGQRLRGIFERITWS